ncbi:MAG: hypothetical protein VKM98_09780 [Cyanobacteriota bacterium]|nr:hypothetical protein [Cyanobacteriota bacterium]
MAVSSPHPRHPLSLGRQLQQLGHWLLDAAGASLGFRGPQDHPSPPNVGVQPFSGGSSRRQRRRHVD